jgi:rod shape determining protein RodA
MFDRRLLQHFDWVLLLLLVVIGMASVLNLYSATYPIKGSGGSQIFMKQAYWFLLGIGVMLLMTTFDYHGLERLAYPSYFFSL